jgi:hypothetical protein
VKGQPVDGDIRYIDFQQPAPSRRIVLLIRQNYTRMECVREIVSIIRKTVKR